MAGTGWQSADLLTRFNQLAGRPSGDAITDPTKYQFLADAQQAVITKIAGIYPRSLYGAPTAMTTADGGFTWTFGTDGDGYALFPMGKAGIYSSLAAVPDYPWVPGVDYLDEGVQIRLPNNRSWAGTLYWYGITPPQELSATVQPVLQPPSARTLIVSEAVRKFATTAVRNADLAAMAAQEFDREFGPIMALLRRHFRGGGALGPLTFPWGRPSGTGGWLAAV